MHACIYISNYSWNSKVAKGFETTYIRTSKLYLYFREPDSNILAQNIATVHIFT